MFVRERRHSHGHFPVDMAATPTCEQDRVQDAPTDSQAFHDGIIRVLKTGVRWQDLPKRQTLRFKMLETT